MKSPLIFAFALSNALATGAAPAAAQCLLCTAPPPGAPRTGSEPEDVPLRIEISSQLDFSRVATGLGGGSVTVDPETGSRRIVGNLVDLGGMTLTGEAVVTGAPGRTVRVFVPGDVALESDSGRSARVVDMATDLGPAPRLGSDGRLRFRFGGRLQVASDDDGNYRGRIPISVEYE